MPPILPAGVPRSQGLASNTFTPPPLDGSLTPAEIYDWVFHHNKTHPLFIFPLEDGGTRTILWEEALRAMYRGAKGLQKTFSARSGNLKSPVVAILSTADVITYFTVYISLVRIGFVPFPISPRNSPSAVAHLLSEAGVHHLLVGQDPAMQGLARSSLSALEASPASHSYATPATNSMPRFKDLYEGDEVSPSDIPLPGKQRSDPFGILHSSGSTSFPKVIPFTVSRWLEIAWAPWFGAQDLSDKILCLAGTPMYHGMGTMQTVWTTTAGLVLSCLDPYSPPQIPTPDSVMACAQKTNSDLILAPPIFVEHWAKRQDYVAWLATRNGILYGGGPLSKSTGEYLTSQSVTVYSTYGTTEAATLSAILPDPADNDWEYIEFSKHAQRVMVPQGDGTYELVLVASEFDTPSVLNTKVDGIDAYATKDLFVPHPTKSDRWKVYGRIDDQIMHSTGEKTNPGPLESILTRHPKIQSCILFGRGQFQVGALIEPVPSARFSSDDADARIAFLNEIWSTVEKMNEFAPQHSRLFKEMVIFVSPEKPFQYTVKMTPRRQAVLLDYATEIDNLYSLVAQSTQSDIPAPATWNSTSTINFVRSVVRQVVKADLTDADDIFAFGCDSLQATWIRNTLLRALRETGVADTRKAATHNDLVYTYPSTRKLSAFVMQLLSNDFDTSISDVTQARISEMEATVQRLCSGLPARPSSKQAGNAPHSTDIVLVTGTTGQLGCSILDELIRDTRVVKIYALNRPAFGSDLSLLERQTKAFTTYGLDPSNLGSGKLRLLQGTLDATDFGLQREIYDELSKTTTRIIHNAWAVNFNLSLASFNSNLRGLRCLIDFAMTSPSSQPPRLEFVSTLGLFQCVEGLSFPLLANHVPAAVAVGSGYSESKWVSEQLLRSAQEAGLPTRIFRVGQLCGTANGSWKESEWFPSIILSSPTIGCLPDDPRNVSWIPVDVAARAIVAHQTSEKPIVHVLHPQPTPWSTLAKRLASELNLSLIPFQRWVQKLEAYADSADDEGTLRRVPSIKLLAMLRAISSRSDEKGYEAFGFPVAQVTEGIFDQASVSPLTPELASLWTKQWKLQ